VEGEEKDKYWEEYNKERQEKRKLKK